MNSMLYFFSYFQGVQKILEDNPELIDLNTLYEHMHEPTIIKVIEFILFIFL
jgi:hypothetical protein